MKKLLSMVLVLVAMLAIFAVPANAAEIALVTDVGTIDDESFNQACWQGVEAYATANNLSYQYYQPLLTPMTSVWAPSIRLSPTARRSSFCRAICSARLSLRLRRCIRT